jgi:MoxR-like ATPase
MSHRIILNAEAQFAGVTVERVVDELLASVQAPTDRVA